MRTVPKSRLLLLELVADLVIFALCAAVCVALLFRARSMSDESTRLTQAVYIAQDAAERLRAGEELYSGYTADGAPVTTVPAVGPGSLEPGASSAWLDYVVYYEAGAETVEISVVPMLEIGSGRAVYTLTVWKEAAP
ncbi:hypothetical protein [Intestinimonas sp.]|uniref:type IV pilus modification PilV family protein n=1 Tax=Intestinimonas sp. TaxID=1965293 RepID=UPI002625875A|nr:hypothetical protein [Intestinimonas sp.]